MVGVAGGCGQHTSELFDRDLHGLILEPRNPSHLRQVHLRHGIGTKEGGGSVERVPLEREREREREGETDLSKSSFSNHPLVVDGLPVHLQPLQSILYHTICSQVNDYNGKQIDDYSTATRRLPCW